MDFDRGIGPVLGGCLRVLARRPRVAPTALGWAARFARRLGLSGLRSGRLRGMTFVVHAFMDADVVQAAWRAMEAGTVPDDPDAQAARERLQACSYGMAHPDSGRIVPACVQHAVLDLEENRRLLTLLPIGSPGSGGVSADADAPAEPVAG
jgi:hypothetical protein